MLYSNGATENARHEKSAQRKLQGIENAGLENAAQDIQG